MGRYGEGRAPSKYSETNVKPEAPSTISEKMTQTEVKIFINMK